MNTIFKYVTKDGREIGYHLSTFCQVGPREKAKQYPLETPEMVELQRQVILKNAKHMLDTTNTTSLFAGVHADIREQHFTGLAFEDIDLVAEETEVPEAPLRVTIISTFQEEDND
jgi:NACalpha-BTF3-like transcription factor